MMNPIQSRKQLQQLGIDFECMLIDISSAGGKVIEKTLIKST
jgi:hypothetical protein